MAFDSASTCGRHSEMNMLEDCVGSEASGWEPESEEDENAGTSFSEDTIWRWRASNVGRWSGSNDVQMRRRSCSHCSVDTAGTRGTLWMRDSWHKRAARCFLSVGKRSPQSRSPTNSATSSTP